MLLHDHAIDVNSQRRLVGQANESIKSPLPHHRSYALHVARDGRAISERPERSSN